MSEAQPPPLAAVIEGHSRYCDPPPKPSSVPSVGWGCSRVAPFPRAALILLGIFSLPDRAEECLRPPQGAGESSWPSTERAPAVPGAAALPREARPEPGALSLPGGGGGITHTRHRTLAARAQMRMDFCSLLCLSVSLGTKEQDYNIHLQRLLPCPALPSRASPGWWEYQTHEFAVLVNSRKTENSNCCFQRGCQRQSFSQSIVAAFLHGYCS